MQSSRVSRLALAAFAAVLLLALSRPIRHAAWALVRLPLTVLTGTTRTLALLPRLPGLAEENAGLRAALAERELVLAAAQEALRHALQSDALLSAAPPGRHLVARVIGRSLSPTQQTLLIDRGARDGLTLGHVVLDAQGVVGRVIEVQARSALILLLTDPESRVAAQVETSRQTGLLVGNGLGGCRLIYLDGDAEIASGDRILTAGLEGPYPKGLLLGTVGRVVREAEQGATSASIRPAVSFGRLEEVVSVIRLEEGG